MINVVAFWDRNPISSWNEVKLEKTRFNSKSFDNVMVEVALASGFAIKTIRNIHTDLVGKRVVKYEFDVKKVYQTEHAECNQAEHKVRLFMEKE